VKVVVTRPTDQAEPLASQLRNAGHEVVLCPLIRIELLGGEVDTSGYDWVVVTSPTGASELARRRLGSLGQVAAIGPGTAAALRDHGIEPDLVPGVSTQEGLLEELPRPAGRVLFAGAEGARRLLVEELDADLVALYRTMELAPEVMPSGDVVVLASASAARAFGRLRLDLPAVSIGPQTTAAAREAGVSVVAEASTHDLDGLVEAVARWMIEN
jgi:uroporphyrinogen III methyltransferase / synthase